MGANEHQIGGDHYKAEYQHWDLVLNARMPYLEAQITRYICRWRKKDGIKDLEKALHYTNKLLENITLVFPIRSSAFLDKTFCVDEAERFCKVNGIDEPERSIIVVCSHWWLRKHIDDVRKRIESIIVGLSKPRSVPLTEENHYTERDI